MHRRKKRRLDTTTTLTLRINKYLKKITLRSPVTMMTAQIKPVPELETKV